jgi:hypothetical protein
LFVEWISFIAVFFAQSAPSDPFKGESTYNSDFLKHQSAVRQAIRPDHAVLQSDQPFDDRTGYRADYVRHPQQERFQRAKEEYAPNKAALDSLTTHKKDFTPKEGQRESALINLDELLFASR